MFKIKITACFVWFVCIVGFISAQYLFSVNGRTLENSRDSDKIIAKSGSAEIDRFDKAVQERFLTEPNFGIRRVMPVNLHLENFEPKGAEEIESVGAFEKNKWRVAMYLFGRNAMPQTIDGKEQKKFNIRYKMNPPIPVTANFAVKDLPPSKELLTAIKTAFLEFQTPGSPNENNYEFSAGDWSYIAKPVRAVNQSCLKCHTDYVVTAKSGDKQFNFRKREIGDANGILVYGFAKKD